MQLSFMYSQITGKYCLGRIKLGKDIIHVPSPLKSGFEDEKQTKIKNSQINALEEKY